MHRDEVDARLAGGIGAGRGERLSRLDREIRRCQAEALGRVGEALDRLLARLAAGERIEERDEMSAVYRENLVHLMTMQADSELAGAYGYVPWIMRAPTVEEKLVVAQIVKDETRHAKVMYDLLAEL